MIVKRSYFLFYLVFYSFNINATATNKDSTITELNLLSRNQNYSAFNHYVDSINFTDNDVIKHITLLNARYLIKSRKLEEAENLLDQFRENITPTQDSLNIYHYSYYNELLGHLLYKQGNIDSAQLHLAISNEYYLENNDANSAFYNYNIISTLSYFNQEYTKALKHSYKALDLTNNYKIDYQLVVDAYIDLGNIYMALEDYLTADSILNQSLTLPQTNQDTTLLAQINNNLGLCAYKTQRIEEAHDYFDKAVIFYQVINSKKGLAKTYNNLALLYFEKLDDPRKSAHYYQRSLKIKSSLSDSLGLSKSYLNIADQYIKKDQLDSALYYAFLAESFGSKFNRYLPTIYNNISIICKLNGDYEQALIYKEKENQILRTINSNQAKASVKFAEDERNILLQKKELELFAKNKQLNEIKLSRNRTLLFIVTISFMFLLTIFLMYVRVVKNKQKVNQELHQKKLSLNTITSLVKGQEEERNRIARDLHDGVGNSLTLLNVKAHNTGNEEIIKLTAKISQEVRDISQNIMPGVIMKLGLKEALKELSQNLKDLNVILDITFLVNNNIYEDKQKQLTLYRVIQELVNNAVKHGKANYISLHFEETEKAINISFEDNGIGFKSSNDSGMGLDNLSNRIVFLHGDINFTSHDNGAACYITLPKNHG